MAAKITITGFVAQGFKATFGVSTDTPGPLKYQWKKNGKVIAGAPSAPSYTTPDLLASDMSSRYSVLILGSDGSKEETEPIGLHRER